MKILWTFDPFEKNKKLRLLGKKIISTLFDTSDTVEALYVATHSEINLTTALDIPKSERYFDYPKKLIQKELKALKLSQMAVNILSEIDMTLTSAVKKLADFALESKTDLIAISTRGKVGLSRFVFGSFAETLIHYSKTDLLLYNLNTRFTKKPKTVLCAHDFSDESVDTIDKLTAYAKKWKATIEIIHIPKSGYWLKFDDQSIDIESYRDDVQDTAQRIESSITKQNIPCRVYIEKDWKKNEAESILSYSKKIKAELIVVNAKSGRIASLMGGSITRKIIRESTLPTLVLKI